MFHATSLLSDGPMGSGMEPAIEHLQRRCDFVAQTGEFLPPIMARATHSTTVAVVGADDAGSLVPADGLVTFAARLPLVVAHSDCVPLFFWNTTETMCGIVHAGWRGVVNGIVGEAIKVVAMHGIRPEDLHVEIGPHIRSCCFVIKEDVAAQFRFIGPGVVIEDGDVQRGALATAIVAQLRRCGIPETAIIDRARCTSCTVVDGAPLYASYRRDGILARNMMSVIAHT